MPRSVTRDRKFRLTHELFFFFFAGVLSSAEGFFGVSFGFAVAVLEALLGAGAAGLTGNSVTGCGFAGGVVDAVPLGVCDGAGGTGGGLLD